MSNPKVFELAKEIGMTPLALMDKIREWKLPVKSHMAELEPEILESIKVKLSEGSKASDGKADKKPAARKKAVAPAATAASGAKAPAKASKAAPAAPPAPAALAKATVVRRKKAEPEAEKIETVEAQAPSEEPTAVEATPASVAAIEAKPDVSAPPAATAAPAQVLQKTEAAPTPLSPAEKVPLAAPMAATPIPRETAPVSVAPAAVAPVAAKVASVVPPKSAPPVAASAPNAPTPTAPSTPTPLAAKPAADEGPERKIIARKKEVSIGNSGVSSDAPAAALVRKNIVGRMDLSRMQAPPGSRPAPRPYQQGGTSGGAATGGPGMANRPKGNLRAGFVQQAAPPEMGPDRETAEEARKRDERRRMKDGAGPAGAATARETEAAAPPAFDAAEFRKREMVFQPKKKKGMLSRPGKKTEKTLAAAHKRTLKVNGSMKVSDMAAEMGMKVSDVTKVMIKSGVMATPNTALDFDTISLVIADLGWTAENVSLTAEELIKDTAFGDLTALPVTRPPVVTIMGHVDHGKTSLLDTIRSANVASGEAGGITQHIGAYQVAMEDGYKITFLDTPGHEAFSAMRARGANVTDIAIIVVAADDGVMPQTAEAIKHAKAAGVPMIVAVNKIDKPGANPDRVKQQLTEFEVVPEEWGGTTMFAHVSAIKKTGIKELLEQIRLIAEVAELTANPAKSGSGTVIEARLEKGRGAVASLLVQDGTVRVGQHIVAGTVVGRIRSLTNDRGERVESAGPGMPVEVLGLDSVPMASDKFDIVKDEKTAEEAAEMRKSLLLKASQKTGKISIEEIFAKVKNTDLKELAIVLKTDVHGSLEALQGMLSKISTSEVKLKVVQSGVGGITESDVILASTAKGLIVGFNVKADSNATAKAKSIGIDIRNYSVVYELIDDLKKAMGGLLPPTVVERVMGRAEIRNIFSVPKLGTIGGCFVLDGKINRSNTARLVRESKVVFEGKIGSLKRFKDDAREVATGFECGIGFDNFSDLRIGDVIEAFVKEEVARTLDGASAAL